MNRNRGFTLIELMLVIVILGIIGSIAVGAFSSSGQDTRRVRAVADAQALVDAAARYYQARFTYEGATIEDLADSARINLDTQNYDFDIEVLDDGQAFAIVARPVAGGAQEGDGTLTIDSRGNRCYYNGEDTVDISKPCPKHI